MKYNIILLFLPSGHVPKGFQRESYEGVSRSFRTGRQERDLQMIQLSANKCSFIAILWDSLVSFAAIILFVASQRVFTFIVYFLPTQSWNVLIHPPIWSIISLISFPALKNTRHLPF